MGTDLLVNNYCSHLWQDDKAGAPPSPPTSPEPGLWHSQLSSECDPGNDHPEQASVLGSWGPKPLGREIRAGWLS